MASSPKDAGGGVCGEAGDDGVFNYSANRAYFPLT